jgi:hypothetical protein
MRTFPPCRPALSIGVATIFLAAWGGSQAPIGAPKDAWQSLFVSEKGAPP